MIQRAAPNLQFQGLSRIVESLPSVEELQGLPHPYAQEILEKFEKRIGKKYEGNNGKEIIDYLAFIAQEYAQRSAATLPPFFDKTPKFSIEDWRDFSTQVVHELKNSLSDASKQDSSNLVVRIGYFANLVTKEKYDKLTSKLSSADTSDRDRKFIEFTLSGCDNVDFRQFGEVAEFSYLSDHQETSYNVLARTLCLQLFKPYNHNPNIFANKVMDSFGLKITPHHKQEYINELKAISSSGAAKYEGLAGSWFAKLFKTHSGVKHGSELLEEIKDGFLSEELAINSQACDKSFEDAKKRLLEVNGNSGLCSADKEGEIISFEPLSLTIPSYGKLRELAKKSIALNISNIGQPSGAAVDSTGERVKGGLEAKVGREG